MNDEAIGREGDPLAQLASAWRALTPPDPTAGVDAPDAATRAVVDWMRAAWNASTPATPRALPWRLRLRTARSRVAPLMPWLAAAAALLVGLSFFARERGVAREPRPIELAAQPPSNEPIRAVPDDAVPQLVSISADRMELRSGPVRLILFTPSQESNP